MDKISIGSGLFEYIVSKLVKKAITKQLGGQDSDVKIVFNTPLTLDNNGETLSIKIDVTGTIKTTQLLKLLASLGF